MAIDTIKSVGILDGSIATADIADDAVTSAKLGAGAVDTTALGTDAVTTAKIAASQITTAKIAASQITNAKIANSTLDLTAKVTGALPVANGGTALARAPHYCSAYLASNTGGIIAVNSTTICPMAHEYVDNANGYNTGTYRYVIPSAGKYMVIGKQMVTHNSGSGQSNQFHFYIFVNGSAVVEAQKDGSGNYDWQQHGTAVTTRTFAQGDYIQLAARVSSGSGTTNYRFAGSNCQLTVIELFGV